MADRMTTISIYASDLDRLKRHQRRVSNQHDQWFTMAEIIRAMINAAEAKTETGE
jgi:hypothetical protein